MSETTGSDGTGGSGGSGGSGAPPGWYPDGTGGTRYWDGAEWAPVGEGPAPHESAAVGAGPVTATYPAYDPHAGSSAAGRSRTGLLVAVIGAVVGLAAIAIVLLLVFSSGDEASSDDPAETVQSFFDAGADRDCEEAVELLSDDLREDFVDECESEPDLEDLDELGIDPDDFEYEVGEADIDGDRATVPVTITGTGFGDVTTDYGLVKEDGAWLIDSFGGPDFDEVPDELPSDLPSGFPSDLPDGFPTEFPSDFPTEFPTDFLEELLENLPDGFPTDFLTEFPDGFPTDFGDFPTDFPTE
ncbi:MAG: hypothetical protein WB767_05145 [Nocardioides sp.]